MKYISVTSPGSDMSKPIFNYFDDYLVSLGEPITNESWNNDKVLHHCKKMLEQQPLKNGLYIDSGGFQIIVGYVSPDRIRSYIDTYHNVLETYKDKIDTIFGLDVFSIKMFPLKRGEKSNDGTNTDVNIIPIKYDINNPDILKLYDLNKYSINESIKLIRKYKEIKDKQIFILQSGNSLTFEIWRKLFIELKVFNHYKRWSIGGLVGLKKKNNSKFSHAVPATLWLLTYQKHFNFEIEQVHWLGQSSRLSFISMALFERLYHVNMSSDSSQLVRFAPLEAKLPFIIEYNNDFKLISTIDEVKEFMFDKHSINSKFYIMKLTDGTVVQTKYDKFISTVAKYSKESFDNFKPIINMNIIFEINAYEYFEIFKKIDNQTFIDFQSQNLYADLQFGNYIADLIMKIGIDNIHDVNQLECLHPIMDRGRTSKELFNNIEIFKMFDDIIKNGDIEKADLILRDITNQYQLDNLKRAKK